MGEDNQSPGFLVKEFHETVNLSVKELEKWLDDPKSLETGQAAEDGEPKGHKSGRQIVEILKKKEGDYTDEDRKHMRAVLAYCKRHLKQGPPSKDVEHSKWRYSLLNWGHDPLKTKRERSRSPVKQRAGSPEKAKSPSKTPEKTPEPAENGAGKGKSPAKGAPASPKRDASPAKAAANGNSKK